MSKTLPVLDAAQSEIIAMVNRKMIFVASLGHNAGGEAALRIGKARWATPFGTQMVVAEFVANEPPDYVPRLATRPRMFWKNKTLIGKYRARR